MTASLLAQLRTWQQRQASVEGVEAYRVLPYKTIVALAQSRPQTREALLCVSGIGPAKVQKYGSMLLAILCAVEGDSQDKKPEVHMCNYSDSVTGEDDSPLSVSAFLDAVNAQMTQLPARVQGEVVTVSLYARAVYFTIKDPMRDSVLSCVIFRSAYDIAGIALAEGVEIVVAGVPEIYKPNGRFNLKVSMIALVGEGALKKAYDALKTKLSGEGLLAPERKRVIPTFPTRIGIITSRDSAAIGDFMSNIGRYGLTIRFVHSSVEGTRAVTELLSALRYMAKQSVDVVVIVRGGGSLESLHAFNNEAVVRALAASPVPVIAGIGHDRDETIATLVADVGVSTPTAAAHAVCASWDHARATVDRTQQILEDFFDTWHHNTERRISNAQEHLHGALLNIRNRVLSAQQAFVLHSSVFAQACAAVRHRYALMSLCWQTAFAQHGIDRVVSRFATCETLLKAEDPRRRLSQGYAIVRVRGHIVRRREEVQAGDPLEILVSDGTIKATSE